jgi:hypothetical protein
MNVVLSGDMYQDTPLHTIPFWPTFLCTYLDCGGAYQSTFLQIKGWWDGSCGGIEDDWVRGWDE